jgi:hypothetical protein
MPTYAPPFTASTEPHLRDMFRTGIMNKSWSHGRSVIFQEDNRCAPIWLPRLDAITGNTLYAPFLSHLHACWMFLNRGAALFWIHLYLDKLELDLEILFRPAVYPIKLYCCFIKGCCLSVFIIITVYLLCTGTRDNIMVEALCYKPQGREFESQWSRWILSVYVILWAA